MSPKNSVSLNGGSSGSHKSSHKSNSSTSSSNSSSSATTSSVAGTNSSRHRINGLKSLVQHDPKMTKTSPIDVSGTNGSTLVSTANGEVPPEGARPTAGNHKVHPSGKKQALVKAIPRMDQGTTTTSELEHKMHKVSDRKGRRLWECHAGKKLFSYHHMYFVCRLCEFFKKNIYI